MAAARYRSGYLLPDSFRVHAYSIDQRPTLLVGICPRYQPV